jgi:hypothetical protein
MSYANGGYSAGKVMANDPAGLTIDGNGGTDVIELNYANGNPLPATLQLNGTFFLDGLSGTNPLAGTTLDLNQSTLYVTYPNTADPLAMIQSYLKAGYNNGGWNGTATATTGAIRSSAAAATPLVNAIGYADSGDANNPAGVPADAIELRYTVIGDTNLDGTVGLADLAALLKNYGTGTKWDQGLLGYGGSVGLADLAALLKHYGQSLSAPADASPALPPAVAAATLAATVPPASAPVTSAATTSTISKSTTSKSTTAKTSIVQTPSVQTPIAPPTPEQTLTKKPAGKLVSKVVELIATPAKGTKTGLAKSLKKK